MLCLMFFHFAFSLGAVGRTLNSIFNLNILLGASEDVPYFGDLVFHQILVERVGDLQPSDERGGNHAVIAVIHPRAFGYGNNRHTA